MQFPTPLPDAPPPPALLDALHGVLDRLDQGVLTLRADGVVLHQNACARHMLERQTELRVDGGRLAFRSPSLRMRFEQHAACAPASDLCFLLPGKPGQGRLQAAVVHLGQGEGGERHLAMFLKAQRAPAAPLQALRQLYGLSAAEAELAAVLADGGTTKDHAATRQVSIHTARSQLKSLSLKLGVSRQAEIVHLVTGMARGWHG